MEKEGFLSDLEKVKKQFPFLEYEFRHDKEYPYKITNDFEISDHEGNHWGTFRASAYFSQSYPRGFPLLEDHSKAFPWEDDWHISPENGLCCVCGIIEQEEVAVKGISVSGFVHDYIHPFYANQVYRQEYGEYKNGEYAHDEEGAWQALEEEFNLKDRDEIRKLLFQMKIKRGRNQVCFCGSGIKYKKCHLKRIKILEPAINLIMPLS